MVQVLPCICCVDVLGGWLHVCASQTMPSTIQPRTPSFTGLSLEPHNAVAILLHQRLAQIQSTAL